jgi:hypothetical protein
MLDAAGIVGAAVTWTIRVTIDALVLLRMAHLVAPAGIRVPGRLVLAVVLGLAALPCVALVEDALVRTVTAVLCAIALPSLVWGLFSATRMPHPPDPRAG